MPASLPYLHTPGTIKTALERIRSAATPERVTKDFVTTVLQLKGGSGAPMPAFLKRLGFAASDGTPTHLYKRFRNPTTAGAAVAEAIRAGYKDLVQANEYFHLLNDKDLQALIVQVTGVETDSRVAALIYQTLKALKPFANFEAVAHSAGAPAADVKVALPEVHRSVHPPAPDSGGRVGLNLSYTINLNLPATSDQAVFNAIFRSLKEHLLSGDE